MVINIADAFFAIGLTVRDSLDHAVDITSPSDKLLMKWSALHQGLTVSPAFLCRALTFVLPKFPCDSSVSIIS